MDLKVSDESLDKLRCSSCMGYLLCSPIRILPDGTNICGRCTSTQVSYRNTSLETLLADALFPCKHENKGCRTRLKFITDFEHETSCTYGSATKELMAIENEDDAVPAIKSSESTCSQESTPLLSADDTIFLTPKAGSMSIDEPSTSGINSEMNTSLPPSRPQSSRSFGAETGRTSTFSNRRNHNLLPFLNQGGYLPLHMLHLLHGINGHGFDLNTPAIVQRCMFPLSYLHHPNFTYARIFPMWLKE